MGNTENNRPNTFDYPPRVMNVAAIQQQTSWLYQANCVSSVVALAWDVLLQRNLHAYTFNFDCNGRQVAAVMVLPAHGQRLPAIICHLTGSSVPGALLPEVITGRLADMASWGCAVIAWQSYGVSRDERYDDNGVIEVGRVLISTLLKRLPFVDVNHISLIDEDRGGTMTYRPFSCLGLTSKAVTITNLADLKRVLERSITTKQESRMDSSPRYADHHLQQTPAPSLPARPLQLFDHSLQPTSLPLP